MGRTPLSLLLSLALVLGGVLYLESRSSMPAPGRADADAHLGGVPRARASAPPDQAAAWTNTILARPLFSPSRRPPEAAASAKPASGALPRLAGVLVSEAGAGAIFTAPGEKPILARPGDRVGPYLVRSIAAGQVTVIGPSGVTVLHPTFAAEAPGQTPPPAAAPPRIQPREQAPVTSALPSQDFIQSVLKQQQERAGK